MEVEEVEEVEEVKEMKHEIRNTKCDGHDASCPYTDKDKERV